MAFDSGRSLAPSVRTHPPRLADLLALTATYRRCRAFARSKPKPVLAPTPAPRTVWSAALCAVTFCCAAVCVLLFCTEFSFYRRVETSHHAFVDPSSGEERLDIELEMTFHRLKCDGPSVPRPRSDTVRAPARVFATIAVVRCRGEH